ncbi:hypothetical protein X942_5808 [Burkholderia pseudomallei MSHR5596]|nr:hypothetical protein X942_5808 [Burkholderia pseudomallei MSHR5596]
MLVCFALGLFFLANASCIDEPMSNALRCASKTERIVPFFPRRSTRLLRRQNFINLDVWDLVHP